MASQQNSRGERQLMLTISREHGQRQNDGAAPLGPVGATARTAGKRSETRGPRAEEMQAASEHVFLPGDDVTEYVSKIIGDASKKFVTGPGLIRDERTLRATVAGRLMSKKDPPVVWIHANQRRVS